MNDAKKARVFNTSGDVVGEIDLPDTFSEPYRPDIIKKAVLSIQSRRYQPHGVKPYAGYDTSAESWGVGRGVSRIARIKNGRRAARSPGAVGGRRAHPPKVEKNLLEKINKKEMRKALRSAIAATSDKDLVMRRGHIFEGEVPIILKDEIEELSKTKEVDELFKRVRVWDDVERAKEKKIRSGKGKMRGRRYKRKRSALIITADDKGLRKASKNLPGVDFSLLSDLNVELLAPGTHAGRLTIWSESAVKMLRKSE
ncbi:MAG: 50S ribosomal protein L4 [Candidatus Methanolliviera sp. GoM_asphalt]|nr:MAG: 50S ribosomal protein L4 [Candidatus Methanolliviera sp. GoM_asphalt]